MRQERLFQPGPTQRKRFWLVERDTGIQTRRVKLKKEERLYLFEVGRLPQQGISGVTERKPDAQKLRSAN